MKEILKKENTTSLIVSIVCLIMIVIIASYTYSFFALNKTNSSIIAGEAESLGLTVTVEQTAPEDNSKLIPQLDAYIDKAIIGRQGSCIDDNGNTVCHTYKVTLTNSNLVTKVTGTITLDNKNNPNLKWALYQNVTNGETGEVTPNLIGDIKTPDVTALTTNEEYTAGQTKEYLIVVWISETSLIQTDSGSYNGVVEFTTVNDLENSSSQSPTLTSNQVLANLGLSVTSGTPNFANTSCSSGCDEATVGIYSAEDDLGTSYYFRGDVTNNYVKFGKDSSGNDMYWRIIRINGDGTVRMIYMGTDINATELTLVGEIEYKGISDDNTYVGYMYGSTEQSTYALTHTNTTNSTIKIFLEGTEANNYEDGWYYENIVATGYHDYVADAIYCNDRSLSSGSGVGTTATNYGAYDRLVTNDAPTLKCDLADYTNDSFTVNTNLGNGLLKYPVGLITADEVAMAGGISNSNFYLYSSEYYWTMTPYTFTSSYASVFNILSGEILFEVAVDYVSGVLPVISLKSNVLQYGTGTSNDPFRVENSTPSSPQLPSSPALTTLTALGLEDKINDTVLTTFTATSKEDGTTGIYKTEDDLGDSYYFRGNIDYNYVKFGKYTKDVYAVYNSTTYSSTYAETCPSGGDCTQIASAGNDMYWRIVRINGDGTIRMIYAGTEAHANDVGGTGIIKHIGETAYNESWFDNAYVGYMYGTPESTTYEDTHANTNNSIIKTMVDLWYDTYLETNYGQYIVDAIYCNDRSLSSGTGAGTTDTVYGAKQRLYSLNTPTLKCEQENDRFTKGTSVSGVTGNGELTNPVGLITADEMTFAGSHRSTDNNEMYLYDSLSYMFWTMSPYESFVDSAGTTDVFFGSRGGLSYAAVDIDRHKVARPVISLSSSVQLTGSGTTGDPFTISS